MSAETDKIAAEQTAVITHHLPDLLDGTEEQAMAAADAMMRTVTSPGHFSGLAIGIAGIGAIFMKRAMPTDGDGMYAIEQVTPMNDRDPKLNAMRVVTMLANDDRETAFAVALQMDQGDVDQSAKFLAGLLAAARGIFQVAKAEGKHLAPKP
ncbi:hypothetical protein [Cryobacterium cryoconiti]|uniref:Uncharacterized protein n=1 Tax=Cryobacterium cryoconiti TaxID=1259239 RepID=A0A4Y8JS45_9MICO|nr:hypothetical protein [Cryobacterium cryoconiti]TFD27494.1 hypothetical protein E3T49_13205 [Cryobacterium cryoconiti]